MTLRSSWQAEGRDLLLEPAGPRLDATGAEAFKTAFASVLAGAPRVPDRVILDLRQVASIDSAGLGALIAGLKRTRRLGATLSLRAVCPEVLDLLEVTLVSRIFEIEPAPTCPDPESPERP